MGNLPFVSIANLVCRCCLGDLEDRIYDSCGVSGGQEEEEGHAGAALHVVLGVGIYGWMDVSACCLTIIWGCFECHLREQFIVTVEGRGAGEGGRRMI